MPPTATQLTQATANSTSDIVGVVAALLSNNNDISIAALIVTVLVGILTALEVYLNWHHLQWERQLERRAAANGRDGPENGPYAGTHEMQPTNIQLTNGAVVEESSDGTSADITGGHQTASSLAGEGLHEPHETEERQGHIADSDHTLQPPNQTQPIGAYRESESDVSMAPQVPIGRSSSSPKIDVNGIDGSIASDVENIQGHIAGGEHKSQPSEHMQPPQPGNVQPGSESDASISLRATNDTPVSPSNAVADGSSIINMDGIAKATEGDIVK